MSRTALFVNGHKIVIETSTPNKIQIYKKSKKNKRKLHFSREFPDNIRIQRFLPENNGKNVVGLIGTETELEPVGFAADTVINSVIFIIDLRGKSAEITKYKLPQGTYVGSFGLEGHNGSIVFYDDMKYPIPQLN